MPLELVNAVAGVATTVLLAASVVAAVILLRHMRAGNQLSATLAIERDFRRPELQRALGDAQHQLAARLADAAYRARLAAPGYLDPRRHPEMILCNWFDRVGSLIRGGYLDESLFLNSFERLVTYYWDLLAPVIAVLRRTRGPGEYAGFEFLAYRAHRRQAKQPARRSLHDAQRPVVADPWLEHDTRT